ncbi:uncharacterized protein METZ01_LOCUS118684 [marine metagenome]|uniref:Uncharacterized protein n=1 Tax=marine metagenome TaxID=408172 RepID=A0A381XMI3_9ZZZZ
MSLLDDNYDGRPLKGRGMRGVTNQQRITCVNIIKRCMSRYSHLKFFIEMPADANLGWLAYYAECVLDGKINPNKAPEVLPLDLNDFIKYIQSSNQNDVIYGPTEGRIKPHKFFQQLGYKSAIKYGYMKMAYVKISFGLKIEDIAVEKTEVCLVENISEMQNRRMKLLDSVVGTSKKNEGQKLLLNLFPTLASLHEIPTEKNWLPMISDISKGRNGGYFDDKTWESYGERLISQAKGVMKSSQSNNKLFDKPKSSIGEQSLVAIVDSFEGLNKVNDVQWNHLISNLKGFTNIVSETPLEIDELFSYQDAGVTTVVPIEVKGIKETLNLSKIFQQFQAFRLKLKHDIELRIFALTEVIPVSGCKKQIELIEFIVDEKMIDAKEGEMLLKAIGSVSVKRRYSFRIR